MDEISDSYETQKAVILVQGEWTRHSQYRPSQ